MWCVWTFCAFTHSQLYNNQPDSIYTKDTTSVFSDDFVKEDKNPIRQWIDWLVQKVGGIFYPQEITTFNTAKNTTIGIIHLFINYALWLLSLVALIYLIIKWFMIITALGDTEKYKKWLAGVKTAAIAIAGIGMSRLIVTFIFYVIGLITG